ANGARQHGRQQVTASANLFGRVPFTPNIAPGATPSGFVDLSIIGTAPIPLGDEDVINFTLPPPLSIIYGDNTTDTISVSSNGWIAVGGTTAPATFQAQDLPDPALPNNTLAPFWTDLDGSAAGRGLPADIVTDGTNNWLVAQ